MPDGRQTCCPECGRVLSGTTQARCPHFGERCSATCPVRYARQQQPRRSPALIVSLALGAWAATGLGVGLVFSHPGDLMWCRSSAFLVLGGWLANVCVLAWSVTSLLGRGPRPPRRGYWYAAAVVAGLGVILPCIVFAACGGPGRLP